MYKVGDRVVLISRLNKHEYGTVEQLIGDKPFIKVLEDNSGRIRLWGIRFMVLAEIYESPLYQVMKES